MDEAELLIEEAESKLESAKILHKKSMYNDAISSILQHALCCKGIAQD